MSTSHVKVSSAKFAVGELIHHKLFDYRGVIVNIDAEFQLSDDWYDVVARTRPPKDQPWYHILVDDSDVATYVAERNLESDESSDEIHHPMVDQFFSQLSHGKYISVDKSN